MRTGTAWTRIAAAAVLGFIPGLLAAQSPSPESTVTPRLTPDQPLPPGELELFTDTFVEKSMSDYHIAGAAVAIVQDGRVVLTRAYGYTSFSPLRAVNADTTLFRIASITKTFGWILLMKQVEAGRVRLDDPVNQHLPRDLQIPDEGFSKPIRVRDLMTHQPGFEDRAFGTLFERDPAEVRPLHQFLLEERPRRVREPGVLSSYSNYGTALAGAIVEDLAGKPWQDVVEAEILKPLALTNVTAREPYPARAALPAPMSAELAKQTAGAFRWRAGAFEPMPYEYISQIAPAGVMSASASSMARYLLMLLNRGSLEGVEIFGEQTSKAFRTPMTQLPAVVGNWNAGFLSRQLPAGFHTYGHDGATLTNFSSLTVVPDLRLGVFITTNTVGGSRLTGTFAHELVERFYASPRAPLAPSADLAKDAERYTGEYLSTRRSFTGLDGFISSLLGASVSVTPEGYLILSGNTETGPQRLTRMPGTEVFRAVSGPLASLFEVKEGEARVLMPFVAAERISFWRQSSIFAFLVGLTSLAAVAVLLRLLYRRGAPIPQTRHQALAGKIRTVVAGLWLGSGVLFSVWASKAIANSAYVFYDWPSALVISASTCALLAALGSAALVGLLPFALRRVAATPGWSAWRSVRFTYTVAVFAAFAILLAARGALQPWAS